MYYYLTYRGNTYICREELLNAIQSNTDGVITVKNIDLNSVATESLNNLFKSYDIHFSSIEYHCCIEFTGGVFKHMLSLAIFMVARDSIVNLINKKGIDDYLYEYIIKNYSSLFTRDVPEYRFRNAFMTSFGLYLLRKEFDLHKPSSLSWNGISEFLSRGSDFKSYEKEIKGFMELIEGSVDIKLVETVGVRSGNDYVTLGSLDLELFNSNLNNLIKEWNV